MLQNPVLDLIDNNVMKTDSYKFSHWMQYPEKTNLMFSYFESRGGKFDNVVFFGLQYYLLTFLSMPITMENVEEAREYCALHGEPFNYEGFKGIVEDYDGYWPVRIKAVPEGMVVPTKNVLMTVESTDEKYFWVSSYLETMLSRIWYPCTIATYSMSKLELIKKYTEATSTDPDADNMFKLHDFGSRGCTCGEQANIGGAAHLVAFYGSDTVEGSRMANKLYGCESKMSAYSIPASEHSSMSIRGRDREVEAYRAMIKAYGDQAIFSCVSDTYDIYNATKNLWGDELKEEVLKMNAVLVIRPDSGDPVEVNSKLVKILDKQFGSTVNNKGYKVLNKVRLIQGDGVDEDVIVAVLNKFMEMGYSAENINFGSGGALLQKVDRDTARFAYKLSYAEEDGKGIDVFKDPVTDPGKKSKKGRISLYDIGNGELKTLLIDSILTENCTEVLVPVFENGKVLKTYTFDEVRKNARKGLTCNIVQ